jgi:hypothetical protein
VIALTGCSEYNFRDLLSMWTGVTEQRLLDALFSPGAGYSRFNRRKQLEMRLVKTEIQVLRGPVCSRNVAEHAERCEPAIADSVLVSSPGWGSAFNSQVSARCSLYYPKASAMPAIHHSEVDQCVSVGQSFTR